MERGKYGDLFRTLGRENEIRANRVLSLSEVIIAFALAVNILMARIGWTAYSYAKVELVLLWCSIGFYTVSALVCWIFGCERPWIKYQLLLCMLLGGLLIYSIEEKTGRVFALLPTFMVSLYYRPKLGRAFILLSALLTFPGVYFHLWIDINIIHYYGYTWDLTIAVVDHVIPMLLFLVVAYLFSNYVAVTGMKSILRQMEELTRSTKEKTEMDTSARLQMSSFPKDLNLAQNGEFELAADLIPAGTAAGDFYDFFLTDKQKLVLLMADVSDKGLPAAMYMMSARNTVRALFTVLDDPAEIFSRANNILFRTTSDAFVTMAAICIDIRTGHAVLVNAGHLPPVLQHRDGSYRLLEKQPELLMGAFEDAQYTSEEFNLETGDTVYLFTDGITEARNSDNIEYGIEQIVASAGNPEILSAGEMCANIISSVEKYSDPQRHSDDRTLLLMRWNNPTDHAVSQFTFHGEWKPDADTADTAIREINALLHRVECPDDVRRLIDTAADDLVNNLYEYSGADRICLDAKASKGQINLVFTDNGVPFNPENAIEQERDPLSIGGLGLTLIRKIMDEVTYSYRDGNINTLMKRW